MLKVSERKGLYAFLVRLFSYPEPELLNGLQAGAGAAAVALVPPTSESPAAGELRMLEVAYTDLFITRLGGAPAPPYGSVYLEAERRLLGESSQQVGRLYRAEGLTLEGNGEPPDFLPTELEFLYYLVEKEERALGGRDITAARQAGETQAAFCRQYLHPWVPEFCRRIAEDEASHPLYRWGADLLERFCRQEGEWLERVTKDQGLGARNA